MDLDRANRPCLVSLVAAVASPAFLTALAVPAAGQAPGQTLEKQLPGLLGMMSARNTAVIVAILAMFVFFVLCRRVKKQRATVRPRGGFIGPVLVVAVSLFPISYCGMNGFTGDGVRAEKRLPALQREVEALREEILASKDPLLTVLHLDPERKDKGGKLYVLGEKEAALEEVRREPGRLHAEGYRHLTGVFAALLGLALVDIFLVRGRIIGGVLQWTILLAAAALVVGIAAAIPPLESRLAGNRASAESLRGLTAEELVAEGKKIFESESSQCLACHTVGEDPKARCPNLEGLGGQAAERTDLSAAEYLVQSVYNPDAFIVSGFPKKQMIPANEPPIALSHAEILAVIAYLNSLGGNTDEGFIQQLREARGNVDLVTPKEDADEVKLPILPGNVEAGRKIFEGKELACSKCHQVDGEGGQVGPELTAIAASQNAEYLLESLIEPSDVIVRGYKQMIVLLDTGLSVWGTPIKWDPDEKHPRTLWISVLESGEVVEKEIDLEDVTSLGDTVVGVERDGDLMDLCGLYVKGDEESGITLKILKVDSDFVQKDGGWAEESYTPQQFDFVNLPLSPMPENFTELLTPQQMYDLLAYLLAQKQKKVKP